MALTRPNVSGMEFLYMHDYTHFNLSYNINPSQDDLIQGIHVAQMWNVPRLFDYSLDHLKRQFTSKKIHAAVVLAIARKNGIPALIKPAVEALANPAVPLHSWCGIGEILRHVDVEEVSAIARMRERLHLVRLALLDVPPVIHDGGCANTGGCARAWKLYWNTKIGKKLRRQDGEVTHQLWWIRSQDVVKAQVVGMGIGCLTRTVTTVASNECWFAETRIVDGATNYLMVTERVPDWLGGR